MQAKAETSAAIPAPCEFIRGSRALAEWLGVSEVSVRRAVRNHTLPVIRFGGALLFRRADVEKTLARLTVPSVAMVRRAGGAA
jgi:excisionase family DNA binding protein